MQRRIAIATGLAGLTSWRLEGDGRWRIVFDEGYDVCDRPPKP